MLYDNKSDEISHCNLGKGGRGMRKYIGAEVVCGDTEFCLKYYIFGERKIGYGIGIAKFSDGKQIERVTVAGITRNLFEIRKLAVQLAKGQVFPVSLSEIVYDYLYAKGLDFPSKAISNNSA